MRGTSVTPISTSFTGRFFFTVKKANFLRVECGSDFDNTAQSSVVFKGVFEERRAKR